MRIGIDVRLQNESGVGRYIRNLVKWLKKIDQKNEYILFGKGKGKRGNGKWKRVNCNVSWHSAREQLVMPPLLVKEQLDLVHFPYFNVPLFYPGKFVVTIHDLILTHFPTGRASTLPYPIYFFKHLGYQFILSQAIKRAKKVIVPSQATKKEVLDHFKISEKKIVVIHEGADFCKLEKRPRLQFIKSPIKKNSYFLYVGNAYPHKNLERLLEAFLTLHATRYTLHAKLVLVGKEDYFYKRLKKTVKEMSLADKVIFYGQANDQELKHLYQNAIALVLPSLMEGFGLPALEAMACGCLVLASDIPALREVCGQAAIYFNPQSEEEIKEKLYKSYIGHKTYKSYFKKGENPSSGRDEADTNKSLAEGECTERNRGPRALPVGIYVEKGLERARLFSWKRMAEQTLQVYQEVVKA